MPAAASGRWSRSTQATDHGAENGTVHAFVQDAALPAAGFSSAARAARCSLGSCAFASARSPAALPCPALSCPVLSCPGLAMPCQPMLLAARRRLRTELPACPGLLGPTARNSRRRAGPSPGDHCWPHTALYQPCAWIAVCVFKLQSGHFATLLAPADLPLCERSAPDLYSPEHSSHMAPLRWQVSRGRGAAAEGRSGGTPRKEPAVLTYGRWQTRASAEELAVEQILRLCPPALHVMWFLPAASRWHREKRAALVGAADGLHKASARTPAHWPLAVGPGQITFPRRGHRGYLALPSCPYGGPRVPCVQLGRDAAAGVGVC